jgi:hypothetical protein
MPACNVFLHHGQRHVFPAKALAQKKSMLGAEITQPPRLLPNDTEIATPTMAEGAAELAKAWRSSIFLEVWTRKKRNAVK